MRGKRKFIPSLPSCTWERGRASLEKNFRNAKGGSRAPRAIPGGASQTKSARCARCALENRPRSGRSTPADPPHSDAWGFGNSFREMLYKNGAKSTEGPVIRVARASRLLAWASRPCELFGAVAQGASGTIRGFSPQPCGKCIFSGTLKPAGGTPALPGGGGSARHSAPHFNHTQAGLRVPNGLHSSARA